MSEQFSIGLLIGLATGAVAGALICSILAKEKLDELILILFRARAALIAAKLGSTRTCHVAAMKVTQLLVDLGKLPEKALTSTFVALRDDEV
jgi:hypothetical protein